MWSNKKKAENDKTTNDKNKKEERKKNLISKMTLLGKDLK